MTRRKRDERLLSALASLLSSFDTSEAEHDDGAHPGGDEDGDSEDSLFSALQQLVASRPQNVLRALQDLVQQFAQGKGRGKGFNPPGSPPYEKGWDRKGKGKGKEDVTGTGSFTGGKGGKRGADANGLRPKGKFFGLRWWLTVHLQAASTGETRWTLFLTPWSSLGRRIGVARRFCALWVLWRNTLPITAQNLRCFSRARSETWRKGCPT